MPHDQEALRQRMGLSSPKPPVRRVGNTLQFSALGTAQARADERVLAGKWAPGKPSGPLDVSQLQALMRALSGMGLVELSALPSTLAAELYRVLVTEARTAPAEASRSILPLSR